MVRSTRVDITLGNDRTIVYLKPFFFYIENEIQEEDVKRRDESTCEIILKYLSITRRFRVAAVRFVIVALRIGSVLYQCYTIEESQLH